jgi:sn-glycerol 3-phosphate transport system permease protein
MQPIPAVNSDYGSKKKKRVFSAVEPFLYLIPCLFFVVLFVYFPFIKTIVNSFFFINKYGVARGFAGLTNYTELFRDPVFYLAVKNSLLYTSVVVPSSLILSLVFALLANKKSIFNKFSTVAFLIPMAVSVSIAAMIFNLLLNPTIGIFDYIFNIGIPWFSDSHYALMGLAIFNIWLAIGFNFLFLTAAIRNVLNEVIESAAIDGANWFQKTVYIVIPLISPTVFFLFCTSTISSLMMASPVLVLTKGGPNLSTTTLVYLMYTQAYQNGYYGYSFALSVVIFLIIGSLLALSFKFEKKGVYYG